MKEQYSSAELELVEFSAVDVINTSYGESLGPPIIITTPTRENEGEAASAW